MAPLIGRSVSIPACNVPFPLSEGCSLGGRVVFVTTVLMVQAHIRLKGWAVAKHVSDQKLDSQDSEDSGTVVHRVAHQ